jgi:DNA-binding response OmpR family regulator
MGRGDTLDILVTSSDALLLDWVKNLLTDEGYTVFATASFHEAKSMMAIRLPRLLIADVNLGAFNGLHLAWHRYLGRPRLPSLIVHKAVDLLLRAEAQKVGAPFLVLPTSGRALLAIVARLLGRHESAHRVKPSQSPEPHFVLPAKRHSHRPYVTSRRES